MTASFSILCFILFCEALNMQFLQCCQKLKNYISLQFYIDGHRKRLEKKNKETYILVQFRIKSDEIFEKIYTEILGEL